MVVGVGLVVWVVVVMGYWCGFGCWHVNGGDAVAPHYRTIHTPLDLTTVSVSCLCLCLHLCRFLSRTNCHSPFPAVLCYAVLLCLVTVSLCCCVYVVYSSTVRSKFQSRRYASLDDLAADLYLMLQNCEDYNQPDSFFGDESRRLRAIVDATLAKLH